MARAELPMAADVQNAPSREESVSAEVWQQLMDVMQLPDRDTDDEPFEAFQFHRKKHPQYGDVDGIPFVDIEDWVPLRPFAEFYAEHRPRLIALVRKVLREHWFSIDIDPEDIVQDTMEMAVRNWPRIGRMRSPDGYLRRVAAKRAVRAMKKSAREVSTSVEGLMTYFEGSLAAGAERSPEEMVVADLVRDVLKVLPHRQAQVLLLTADGWSDSQIGESLHMRPATVRSHRRHVKKVFTQRLPPDSWRGLAGSED
jgi:RNA polymerase sigma-70 factor (ECF subfamily)